MGRIQSKSPEIDYFVTHQFYGSVHGRYSKGMQSSEEDEYNSIFSLQFSHFSNTNPKI